MYHRPPNDFIYSAYKIKTTHTDGLKEISGHATGFVLEIGNGIPWIVTNRHVIDLDYKKTTAEHKNFKLKEFKISGRLPDDTEYTFNIKPETSFFFHKEYNNDVVLILPRSINGTTNKFHWHFGFNHLASVEDFKTIYPFDIICFSGFPHTHDKLMGRPILRCGTISSDPNYNYSWNETSQGDCVAYEGFSTAGASGSPIFASPRGLMNMADCRNGFLIGVNGGHIPDQHGHSGISYFYKSTVIHEIIESNNLKFFPLD